jgi:hypothetical protein
VQWYSLTVTNKGGGGHIWDSQHKIMCGSGWGTCTAWYPSGAQVTVTPTPGYWGYALTCSTGSSGTTGYPCTMTMNANQTAVGQFETPVGWSHFTPTGGTAVASGATIDSTGQNASQGTSNEVLRNTYPLPVYDSTANSGYYWEMKVTSAAAATNVGSIGVIMDTGIAAGMPGSSQSLNDWYIGGQPDGVGTAEDTSIGTVWTANWYNRTITNAGAPPTGSAGGGYVGYLATGQVWMFAFNASTGQLWVGMNGVWWYGGNPTNGTNPAISGLPANIYPAMAFFGSATLQANLNWGNTALAYQPPWGF